MGPAKKPETHLTVIFRTFTHLLKGTLNTVRRLTAPITTPVHHFTTKLTTKVMALTTKVTSKVLTLTKPITTKVMTLTRPVVTKVTTLTKPITTRVARLRTCPFVDCFALKTWTATARCLWTTECNIIHKVIGHVTLL